MKIVAIAFGVLVALVAIGAGFVVLGEDRAAGRAAAFCERFRPGSPFADAQRAAEREIERPHRTIRDADVTVTFQGAVPLSLHLCTIKAVDGKVTEARTSHVD